MSRRLPNTNEVIAQVKVEAIKRVLEKQASLSEKSMYTTGVAKALHKLATTLRSADLNRVTYDEVAQFVNTATRHT